MTALLHPGVYVREIPSGIRSIEGAATSTTIFVGETERGPSTPTKIRGIAEYDRLFGGYQRRSGASSAVRTTMRYAIEAYFQNGGSVAYVLRGVSGSAGSATRSYTDAVDTTHDDVVTASSDGVWANDARVVFLPSSDGSGDRFRLVVLTRTLGTTELEYVEDWDRLSLDPNDELFVQTTLERSRYFRWTAGDTFNLDNFVNEAELPTSTDDYLPADPGDWTEAMFAVEAGVFDETKLAGGAGGDGAVSDYATVLPALDGVDDASLLVAAPEDWAQGSTPAVNTAFKAYVDARPQQDLLLIADMPRGADVSAGVDGAITEAESLASDMVAAYWPHLLVADPVNPRRGATLTIPPAGAVAGLYARTDSRRGVFKAPAGSEASINGIAGVEHQVLDTHQDDLNPAGVNAIRLISGAGTVAWGARTLRPNTEWRYVAVRRMAMFLRKSIYASIQWAVFEPNDTLLWDSLRASVSAFMNIQFRNGAFAGTSPDQAYFVKVDSETTTEADRAAGIVNVLVGFAPLRPAEFVVVQLSQKSGASR